MAKTGSGKAKGKRGDPAGSVGDAVASVIGPLGKQAAKEIDKLESKIAKARATEAKRLRQLAEAQAVKGRKAVAKRRRQVEEATGEVTGLVGRLAKRTAATGAAAVGSLAREVGSAAVQAAESVSPDRSQPRRVRASTTRPPVTRTAKPATTRKPRGSTTTAATVKPATTTAAKPPATARKASTTATTRKPRTVAVRKAPGTTTRTPRPTPSTPDAGPESA